MSHIVEIAARVRDRSAISAACQRLSLAEPIEGTAELYSGRASGLLLQLPGWVYPAVIDLPTGQVRYDNFEGRWGEQSRIDAFLQAYAVEKARLEARKAGQVVAEQTLEDGSIKLTIQVA